MNTLGYSHPRMAKELGVSLRTTNNYARKGAPETVALAIETLKRRRK